ncbi:FKBP-type peptidyl-prolyl cis-trans isomerase [Nitratidesulfovibrio vulgaris]|uniref:Peptidyl-prolyl cis-trans isomerase n=2 Tax=Nitratidesulfovibrio vulgaris TaxID=881 RepID=Q728N4_NITV2|nr:peptidylprolyl isomerase [Nitratidesulfovibrio vulgaris]GEB81002.1 peptidyl-prolyl cis-trans isomerase [Desulfovibrio desulfuricans]HBW16130.1 peptidylprolyl isomerase [Desulfovibrio sp.]AAS97041.1 peptidyl-prolyl cis-trans isomerase, FKBP-type [Nitratidesulfovibrio vulgaris str. Hildenborough]ABM27700.1 peptidylprolyl isomerase, FKBP-type [Nitratidesulfovibrio vulgaris DP4]ADP87515.1 peptidylprolyl isomerase FKBP-type [Nitratidesulfovibrio vulgaris RCH1]
MAIQNGATVRVHYTGTLDDGTEFDSSRDREPLEFTLGEGMLIPGFEKAVLGLSKTGDAVKVVIPAEDAYGERLEELVISVPRDQVPPHIEPEVGLMLQLMTDGGEMEVAVTEVTDEAVTLDANHPLAGETLTFDIELVEVL